MIQQMLAIWSLVSLPFLKPAWTPGSSRFTYCWSLAWRILSINLLVCEMSAIVRKFEHSLALPFVALVVSDFLRPHRRQPTRLLCLWDSPGKNTGVGCHFLLPDSASGKDAGDVRDSGSIPWSGRSPRGGNGNQLQHSCWENPIGQRSLPAYSPWGHKELDITEHLSMH